MLTPATHSRSRWSQRWAALLIAAMALAGAEVGSAQTIVTSAGTGTPGNAVGATGPTTDLDLPGAVHVDAFGLYVADTGNNRILFIDNQSGVPVVVAGTGVADSTGDGGLATAATLNGPTGVFAAPSGNIYVVDSGNHRIRLIEAGLISTLAGSGVAGFAGDDGLPTEAQLSAPTQVFVTADEDSVFIADTGNHRIRVIVGSKITTVAGTGVAGFFGDDSLAVKAQLNGPTGVFSDTTNARLYIADTNNHRIRFITAGDTMRSLAGTSLPSYGGDGGPPAEAGLAFPRGVFADPEGNVYIADTFNQRIRRVNAHGSVTTVAGDGLFGYAGDDGPANRARLRSPVDVFVDSSGQITIADRDNHRIRRVDPDNVVLHGDIGAPGRETQLFSVGFTGDGSTSVEALTLTLLGSPDNLDLEGDFDEFRLYESVDANLDTSGSPDARVGAIESSSVTLGVPFTIALDAPRTPATGTERHYLVSALVGSTATEHDSVWVEFATGDLQTSTGGRGMVKTNPDTSAVLEVDVVATKLVFSTQPAGSISGITLNQTPVVEAWDDLNFLDHDFVDTVTLTTDASGQLQFNAVTAVGGVAAYPNLAYVATADEEAFTLTADDEAGGAETNLPSVESSTITSSSVNDPPVVTIPVFAMQEDVTLIRPLSDFILDVDDTEFTIVATSDHLLITVEDGQITLVPEPDFSGPASLSITATDAFGAQDSDETSISIASVNDPPTLSLPASVTIAEDDTLRFDLRARTTDPDHDFADLGFLISPSPGLVTSLDESSGLLKLWTTPDSSGSFTATISVDDGEVGVATETVAIEIEAVNDDPVIGGLPDVILEANSSMTLTLDAYVEDDAAVSLINWTVLPGGGLSAEVDAANRTVRIRAIPGFQGVSSLFFGATDAEGGADSETAEVLVLAPGEEPPSSPAGADFDGSGRVDLDDFFLFSDAFGSTQVSPGWDAAFDLDASGTVDFDDFFLFADAFGTTATE